MVSEESAELRALRTFVPYVSRTPRALCLTCSRALRASYLVTHMPRALRFSFSAGLVSYVLSCPTCSREIVPRPLGALVPHTYIFLVEKEKIL